MAQPKESNRPYRISFNELANLDILENCYHLLSHLFGLHFSLIDSETRKYVSFFKPGKLNPFCLLIQSVDRGKKQCIECDKLHIEECISKRKICVYRCHAGLMDFTIPISIDELVVGVLICGQVLDRKPSKDSWQRVYRACRGLKIDFNKLRRHYFNTPVILSAQKKMLMELISIFTRYFADAGSRIILLKREYENRIFSHARDYIIKNFTQPLTLADIALAVYTSERNLSRIFQSQAHTTVMGFLCQCRLEHAYRLLLSTDDTVLQIALDSGFGSLSQFNRSFVKEYRTPPGKWRKKKRLTRKDKECLRKRQDKTTP